MVELDISNVKFYAYFANYFFFFGENLSRT